MQVGEEKYRVLVSFYDLQRTRRIAYGDHHTTTKAAFKLNDGMNFAFKPAFSLKRNTTPKLYMLT